MPSIKKNVIFNYIGQFYIAFIGIVTLPLYLKYLGAEAYGLVGFFTLLQSWMQLLDLGLSPTLSREVARLRDSPEQQYQLRTVVRSLEVIFLGIAIIVSVPLFVARSWIASQWLTIHELNLHVVSVCIGLMAVMIGARWLASLHRSGINAYEEQVWINVAGIFIVTLRFPGALLLIIWSNGSIILFFSYQLVLAFIEQVIITRKFYQLLPRITRPVTWFSTKEVKRIAPFALSIAYTGGIWIIVSQLDKLLLSKVLPLAEYGYFTLVAVIASSVVLLSSPVSNAILPRMTALLSQDNEAEMRALYRKATRFVVCAVTPITLVITFFPEQVVYIWTGDQNAAAWTAPVLPLFMLGNGLLAIGAFQYYLQYAHGQLKLHVQYNTAYAVLFIPVVAYAAFHYGPMGVGYVWLAFRLFSLVVWTPYVHKVFAPGLNADWMLKDVLPPILTSALLLTLFLYLNHGYLPGNRAYGFIVIASLTVLVTVAALFTAFFREITTRVRLMRYRNLL